MEFGNMKTITEKQLHILQHSLGLDSYGQGRIYRNRFVTGPESDDFPDCRNLVEANSRTIAVKPVFKDKEAFLRFAERSWDMGAVGEAELRE